MSRRFRNRFRRFPIENKFDRDWTERNNYYYPKNNKYFNNDYRDNYYHHDNNDYYDYNSNYKDNNFNNRHYNNKYHNKRFNRGRYPFYRKTYIEVEVGQEKKIDEKFIKELENLGYFIKEVKGDGNCLFRSVSEQIEGDENNHQIYRQKCVEYMKENKDEFSPFLEEDEPFDTYIEKISKDGEWGGNLEIYALSMALEANFYIYIHEQPCYVVKNWDNPKVNIMLTYHSGNHYNSLRKLEEKNDENKEKEEKTQKEENNEEKKEDGEKNEIKEKNSDDINDFINKVNHLNI